MRVFYCLLLLWLYSSSAEADKRPDQRPFLRIEAGMHTSLIRQIGLSEDGRILATGSNDKTVRLWALPEGNLALTIRVPIDSDKGGQVFAVALSPNGKIVAAGGWGAGNDMYIYIYNAETGALNRRLGPLPVTVHKLNFSADGKKLVAALAQKNGIRVWEANTGKLIGEDQNFGDGSYNASFSKGGQLAVTSDDGFIRVYNSHLKRIKQVKAQGGKLPFGIAFSPQGDKLVVGYDDTVRIDVLSSVSLEVLYTVDTTGVTNGNLASVAWSNDGNRIFAGGVYDVNGENPLLTWDEAGKGKRVSMPGHQNTVHDLLPYGDSSVAYGAGDPAFGIVNETGKASLSKGPITADVRDNIKQGFIVSENAQQVHFTLSKADFKSVLIDVTELDVAVDSLSLRNLQQADTSSLPVTNWLDSYEPKLDKLSLKLEPYEHSRSLAIIPDASGFLLGAEWYLRRFDAKGNQKWKKSAPGIAWGVNTSVNGKIAVAAYGDGTIRWHRMTDGAELLAFFIHVPTKRWVLWTPSGYYAASPGGEDLIGWHLNGKTLDDPVDFFPASRFRDRFYRPDIVKLMLATLDETEAVKQANKASGRTAEMPFSRKILPPVIGISADPRGLETDAAEIDLDYLLRAPSGRKVSKIEVRVDGRLFATETGEEFLKPSAKTTRSLKVPLPKRDAEVSVVAFHDDQAGEPSRIKVHYTGAPAPTAKTTLRALLVGVSAYNNTDLTLNYADNDASDLARVLKEQEGRFFKKVETTVLLDGNANEANIEAALADLAAKTGPDDYAVVFLAGHGLTDKNRFYFVPADVDVADGKLRDAKTAVSQTTILKALSSMKGKVLFFIDACFSADVFKVDSTGFVNAITSEENAVMMYSSSQGDQVSLEDPKWENGAFTEALMQIFADPKSYNANGEINTDDLTGKLKERVRALTDDKQTPVGQSSRAIAPFPVMGL